MVFRNIETLFDSFEEPHERSKLQEMFLFFVVLTGVLILKKSNFYYTRLIPFRVSRVGGAHLHGFAPRPTQSRLQR